MSEENSNNRDKEGGWFPFLSKYILNPITALTVAAVLILVLFLSFFIEELAGLVTELVAGGLLYVVGLLLGFFAQARGWLAGIGPGGSRDFFDREKHITRTRYDEEIQKWRRITNQIGRIEDTAYNFKKIENVYFIYENGDTRVRQRYHIEVLSDTFQYFRMNMVGDLHSTPIYDLVEQTEFRVDIDKADTDLEFIATVDEPKRKRIALFVLPKAVKNDHLLVTIEYTWPVLMGDLLKLGETIFDWDYDVRNPSELCDLTIELNFQKSIGPIDCAISHPNRQAHEELVNTEGAHKDWTTWIYSNPQANVNETNRYSIKIRKDNGVRSAET